MPLNQPLKMDLDLVRRFLGQDIEIVNKTGSSRIAVAEGVPIYLDKATQQVKLEYLSSLGGINFALGGIDAYQFLADTLNFVNDAKFIQNPAGVKDASGTKRIVIVQPSDDLKSVIENSTAGQIICLTGGIHTVTSTITWPAHPLHLLGIGNPVVEFTQYNVAFMTHTDASATVGTRVENIEFKTTPSGLTWWNPYERWTLINVKFSSRFGVGTWGETTFISCVFDSGYSKFTSGTPVNFYNCYFKSGFTFNSNPLFSGCIISTDLRLYGWRAIFVGCKLESGYTIQSYPSSEIHSIVKFEGCEIYGRLRVNGGDSNDITDVFSVRDSYIKNAYEGVYVSGQATVRKVILDGCAIIPQSGFAGLLRKDADATVESFTVCNCVCGGAELNASLASEVDFYGNSNLSITGV